MKPLLDTLAQVDLSSHWRDLLAFLKMADPVFVGVLLGLTTLLGLKMVSRYRSLRTWGLCIAFATLIICVGESWWEDGYIKTKELGSVFWRGLVTAGLVLAPLWIVFPILVFLYNHLRLAVTAFLAYVAYVWTAGNLDLNNLFAVAVGGGITAGLALVVAWIVQPMTDFLQKYLLVGPTRKIQRWHKKIADQKAIVEEKAAQPEPKKPEKAPQPETPPDSQDDEVSEADQRRAKARMKAELCYNLYELAIGTVFPRSMFEEFVTRYLGDHHDPDRVEQNVVELESIILQYVNVSPQSYPPTIPMQSIDFESLTQWFLTQKQRVDAEEFDAERRKMKLNALTRRYTQLAEQLMEEKSDLPMAEVAVLS